MPSNQREMLDPTNVTLLAELQGDARLTLAELGRRVGLSSPAVAERLQRLQDAGVITGYHAAVDPRALGYTLGADPAHPPGTAPDSQGRPRSPSARPRSSSATGSRARTASS